VVSLSCFAFRVISLTALFLLTSFSLLLTDASVTTSLALIFLFEAFLKRLYLAIIEICPFLFLLILVIIFVFFTIRALFFFLAIPAALFSTFILLQLSTCLLILTRASFSILVILFFEPFTRSLF